MGNNKKFDIVVYKSNENKLNTPFRVAHISDLHLNEFGPENCHLMHAMSDGKPDLICITGDLVNNSDNIEPALNFCRKASGIAPTYMSVGNHEIFLLRTYRPKLLSIFESAGVNVLDNKSETIIIKGNTIDIGGVTGNADCCSAAELNFLDEYVKKENFKLLLAHDPFWYDKKCKKKHSGCLINKGVNVALCGHRHGGQVYIPYIGGVFAPDYGLFAKLVAGVHKIGNTDLVISRGLGNPCGLPRINNPFELIFVDIS